MSRIADRLGRLTDKFASGYYPTYRRLADTIGPAGHVLEVGVDQGGSLLMWQELFPYGLVAGADDGSGLGGSGKGVTWPAGTAAIRAGQDDPRLAAEASALSPDGYDLVVDDASHDGLLSEATFRLLWPLVKPGRWYVLEDWAVGYLPAWSDAFGGSMLSLAQSFLTMLAPDSELDVAEYRFGQAILHKRGPA